MMVQWDIPSPLHLVMSSCPHVLVSSCPHVLMSSCPHLLTHLLHIGEEIVVRYANGPILEINDTGITEASLHHQLFHFIWMCEQGDA